MSRRNYEEAYLRYDAEGEGVRLDYDDGSSLFLTKDDTFEAFINGDWEYTWIFNCAEGWFVSGVKGNVSLMDGTKVKIRIQK